MIDRNEPARRAGAGGTGRKPGRGGFYGRAGKRLLDIALASSALIVLLPLMAVVGLLVLAALGRPVFFRQLRPGLRSRPFTVYKFRTMRESASRDGAPVPDAERLTRLGRILRATSLDELPTLWNVIRGDMSLVGPRPLLVEYLPRYTAEQARRHEVRPGITGWAQVNGRNAISWERKFDFDVWYVENASFWLDLNIIWLTLWRVLRREGISSAGSATAARFKGIDRE